ncbi:hypothetical protein [Bacillus fonticola]|uniref:hypothetical protein n=1 Tax=Bacillus fonticola TaxID=2728853 RepID=UPI0014763F5F|nr:hypothetical protein [Bacillus fonticola]
MITNPVISSAILLALIAVGEIISIKTRARVPMLLIALLGYLVLSWTGVFPEDLLANSTMITVGGLLVAPLIVHLGTLIPLKTIVAQWRAVCIALIGIAIATILLLVTISPLFGYEVAVAGAGPLTGGIIAFIVTSEKLEAVGFGNLVAIPALILAFQKLIGIPLAQNMLRKYALRIRDSLSMTAATVETTVEKETTKPLESAPRRLLIPEEYQNPTVILFTLFVGGSFAYVLDEFTGLSYSIWSLVIGLAGTLIGFFPPKAMERANSTGIAMIGIVFVVIGSMDDVTFAMFLEFLPIVVLMLIIGAVGIVAGGFIGSKIFKWDPFKGIPIALTAMFGFPADYILVEEVSRSLGRTKEEEEAIFNELLSPMLIGGFTTVTTASILVAGILVGTL